MWDLSRTLWEGKMWQKSAWSSSRGSRKTSRQETSDGTQEDASLSFFRSSREEKRSCQKSLRNTNWKDEWPELKTSSWVLHLTSRKSFSFPCNLGCCFRVGTMSLTHCGWTSQYLMYLSSDVSSLWGWQELDETIEEEINTVTCWNHTTTWPYYREDTSLALICSPVWGVCTWLTAVTVEGEGIHLTVNVSPTRMESHFLFLV